VFVVAVPIYWLGHPIERASVAILRVVWPMMVRHLTSSLGTLDLFSRLESRIIDILSGTSDQR
jgi:hypothetical protein